MKLAPAGLHSNVTTLSMLPAVFAHHGHRLQETVQSDTDAELIISSQVKKQQEDSGGADKDAPKLAPVGPNSLAWGGFMAVAGNARYQVVNCIEDRVLVSDPVTHAHIRKQYSTKG